MMTGIRKYAPIIKLAVPVPVRSIMRADCGRIAIVGKCRFRQQESGRNNKQVFEFVHREIWKFKDRAIRLREKNKVFAGIDESFAFFLSLKQHEISRKNSARL